MSQKLNFDVYWKDEKTGRIELDGVNLLKNEYYVKYGLKYPFMKYPFIYMKNGFQIMMWLEGIG